MVGAGTVGGGRVFARSWAALFRDGLGESQGLGLGVLLGFGILEFRVWDS